jgi:hypothetical protein
MNKPLERSPNEYTLSIVIRNFILKASIIKPRTTFMEFSQPPDFGIRLIIDGNKANIVNGRANAIPNPIIPIVGLSTSPLAASTSRAPIIGPVHENETITVVSPIKNAARIPPLSTLESARVTQLFGRRISNAPKNEIENTTNNTKNIVLGIQWVLNAFANPAPALVSETIIPSDE